MSAPDLDAIQARLDAATPGPWVWDEVNDLRCPFDPDYSFGEDGDGWVLTTCNGEISSSPADADLIAHAPADLAALLAEVKRLTRWKAEATEVISAWEAIHGDLGEPGALGESKAAATRAEVKRLTAWRDEARAALAVLRGDVEALVVEHQRSVKPAPYTSERALIERLAAVLANHPTTKEADRG